MKQQLFERIYYENNPNARSTSPDEETKHQYLNFPLDTESKPPMWLKESLFERILRESEEDDAISLYDMEVRGKAYDKMSGKNPTSTDYNENPQVDITIGENEKPATNPPKSFKEIYEEALKNN